MSFPCLVLPLESINDSWKHEEHMQTTRGCDGMVGVGEDECKMIKVEGFLRMIKVEVEFQWSHSACPHYSDLLWVYVRMHVNCTRHRPKTSKRQGDADPVNVNVFVVVL
ncbi:hypothetical protein CROQUDRAFT_532231 [Cronartium quercuum f. sp. fusiforme G11]|uniref:Uncharacterized protein n=1 Tax=Cronartium quercuum f. sp. fusiforme G11 TaxID=708437 RepID=A0A9P6TBW7_9BASI|nr:hypothetical protein CROQUDRAFT_532231 [Cronartium quercuum f. sp. fusiforme G11]